MFFTTLLAYAVAAFALYSYQHADFPAITAHAARPPPGPQGFTTSVLFQYLIYSCLHNSVNTRNRFSGSRGGRLSPN